MYSGFNVGLDGAGFKNGLLEAGRLLFDKNQEVVRKRLSSFVGPDGKINGTDVQGHWFPTIQADVFISHSHKDLDLALSLSGWLQELGVSSFVDSCVWGNADHLLREIDDRFCWNEGRQIYIYSDRNRSTSHVHMMLATALSKMIDHCESIFFLNTPNSITSAEVMGRTESPWLYHELNVADLVQKKSLSSYRPYLSKAMSESLGVTYSTKLSNLVKLAVADLNAWRRAVPDGEKYPLDVLYERVKRRKDAVILK
jgi:hypothetical protein